jgi:DNA-directed RNA polymerase subunit beta'
MKIRKISSSTKFNKDKLVTNPDVFSRKTESISDDGRVQELKVFSEDGLFSTRIFGNLNTESEYACSCNKYNGKIYEGLVCDSCNSEVILIEANIDKMGWIDLKDVYVIKYVNYFMLEKVIGRENLKKIITFPNRITMEGNLDMEEVKAERNISPENRFWYIGTQKFLRNYSDLVDDDLKTPEEIAAEKKSGKKPKGILEYYHDLHDKKESRIYEFLLDSDHVFTNVIPVISTVLRPAMRTEDGLKMDEINNIYINILTSVKILQDTTNQNELSKATIVEALQAQYFQLSEKILENIKSKNGLIRSQIMGTRINFSARNIISPAKAGVKIDEIVLPYMTFLNLYKFELMNIISKVKNVKYIEAERIWYKATLSIDEEVYKIMTKMITDEEIGILLNRNPTISFGSILYLSVSGIKKDYEDLTMSIHNGILSLLAGDYDGDVLNVVSLKDKEMKIVFREVFSPINLIIDANDGHFNSALNLERDQVLGLNNLLT